MYKHTFKTEYFVRWIQERCEIKSGILYDIGIGDGYIAQQMKIFGDYDIQGSDIDKESVAHCNSLGIKTFEGDLLTPFLHFKPDIITANLPYSIRELAKQTPGMYGGTKYIKELLRQIKSFGWTDLVIYLECLGTQIEEITEICNSYWEFTIEYNHSGFVEIKI